MRFVQVTTTRCLGWAMVVMLMGFGCTEQTRGVGPSPDSDVGAEDTEDTGEPVDAEGGDDTSGSAENDASSDEDGSAEPDTDQEPSGRFVHYISSATYPRMILEVDSVAGMEPRAGVARDMEARLSSLLDKPSGVEVINDGTIPSRGSDHGWTDQELSQLAQEHFDRAVADDVVKMHVMFLDGHSARDDDGGRILGLAWGHTYIVIFKRTLESACRQSALPTNREQLCSMAELAVWLHEVGHNLGLVDNGLSLASDHRDPDHPKHCDNDNCLMYWAWKGPNATDQLLDRLLAGQDTAPAFDAQCRADIDAAK